MNQVYDLMKYGQAVNVEKVDEGKSDAMDSTEAIQDYDNNDRELLLNGQGIDVGEFGN